MTDKSKSTKRKKTKPQSTWFGRYYIWILVAFFCVGPFFIYGALQAMDSNKNEVDDCLPTSFKETDELAWHKHQFAGDQFVIDSWDRCTIEGNATGSETLAPDPRIDQVATLLVSNSPVGGRTESQPYSTYFKSITTAGRSTLWLLGTNADAIILSMPPLVYVLAISSSIHLINYYCDALNQVGPKAEPRQAIKSGWKLALYCSLTTAIGLVSLCTSEITPIRHFGFYSVIGVMKMHVVLFLFLPAALYACSPRGSRGRGNIGQGVNLAKIRTKDSSHPSVETRSEMMAASIALDAGDSVRGGRCRIVAVASRACRTTRTSLLSIEVSNGIRKPLIACDSRRANQVGRCHRSSLHQRDTLQQPKQRGSSHSPFTSQCASRL